MSYQPDAHFAHHAEGMGLHGVPHAAGVSPPQHPSMRGPPLAQSQHHTPQAYQQQMPNTVEQRVQAEVNSMKGMLSTLLEALQVFTTGSARAEQVTMSEACELLGLIVTILQQDLNVGRIRHLLFDSVPEGQPTVFSVLLQYLNTSFTYAPGVTSPEEMKVQIARIRATTLKTLAKLISFTSLDHYPGGPETAQVSQLCARSMASLRGVEVLLSLLCGGPQVSEEHKIGAVECLLALIVRNSAGRQGIVETPGGLLYMSTALRSEKSPVVRNYAATCIRELASTHPSHVIHSDFPEEAVELIAKDSSADVRECAIKTLEIIFKADTSYVTRYPLKKELAVVLHNLLETDTNADVAKVSCRLLSALFSTEGKQIGQINHKDMPLDQLPLTFTLHWAEIEGYRTLLHVSAGRNGPKVATFASRAFRDFVQHCPWQLQIGHKLIENWTSVDVLLKVLQPSSAPQSDDTDAQIPLVELSISLAMLFAQSPFTRTSVHRELSGFPAYLPALRSAIMGHLNRAELAYYSGIELYDLTGTHINSLQGIQWNVNPNGSPVAKKASLRQIFVSQEQRVAERSGGAHAREGFPSTTYDEPEVQKQKETRLTFVILLYVIHLALAPGMPAEKEREKEHLPHPQHVPAASSASSSTEEGSVPTQRVSAVQNPQFASPHYEEHLQQPPPPAYLQNPHQHHQHQHQHQHPPQHHHHHHHHHHQQPPSHLPNPNEPSQLGYGATPDYTPMPTRTSTLREVSAHPDRAQAALMRQMRESYAPGNETVLSQNLPSQIHGASVNFSGMPAPQQYAAPSGEPSMARSRRTSGFVSGQDGYEPMFPTAGRPSPRSVKPAQNPELRQTYSKFDHALRLTIHFAQYFNRKVDKRPTYKATPDGYAVVVFLVQYKCLLLLLFRYMIRQTHIANPWTPVAKKNRLKSWSVKDLKVRLFYVPFLSQILIF